MSKEITNNNKATETNVKATDDLVLIGQTNEINAEVLDQVFKKEDDSARVTFDIFGVEKRSNLIDKYEVGNNLRKGFINTNINPFTGDPIFYNSDTSTIFELAGYYLPSKPIRDNEKDYKEHCESDLINMHYMRINIASHFKAYARHAISQMINFANVQLDQYLKSTVFNRSETTAIYNRYARAFNEFRYLDDSNITIEGIVAYFKPVIFLGFANGVIYGNNANSVEYRYSSDDYEESRVVGSLLSLDYYVTNDIGVVLSTLIPCLEMNSNRIVNALNLAGKSVFYNDILDAYNKFSILLLTALENVLCQLQIEAKRLYVVGGPGMFSADPKTAAMTSIMLASTNNEPETIEVVEDSDNNEENDK